MSKKGFALLELGCAALLAFTYFTAGNGNGMLLICAIVLVIDCLIRFFKSSDDE